VVTGGREDNLAERWLNEPGSRGRNSRIDTGGDFRRCRSGPLNAKPLAAELPAGTSIKPAIIEEPNATHSSSIPVTRSVAAGHLTITIAQEIHS